MSSSRSDIGKWRWRCPGHQLYSRRSPEFRFSTTGLHQLLWHARIHPNPETGRPYVDIRKQWKRLLAIAAEILGYELTGKKAKFLKFRYTGASHIAQRARAARNLLVADVEVFAQDLEPVCDAPGADDDDAPAVAVQPPPRRSHK